MATSRERRLAMLRIDHPLILPLVPQPAREAVLLLWRLDARLAELAHAGREPALRLIRLRWWADRIAALDAGVPAEPLLLEVRDHLLGPLSAADLASLAEDWFGFVESDGGTDPANRLFTLTSRLLSPAAPTGSAEAAALWFKVALLLARGEGADWSDASSKAVGVTVSGWPRPLAALAGLARAIALRQGARSPGLEQLLLLRIGLIGR
jgi:15-cis-phytoene synthase